MSEAQLDLVDATQGYLQVKFVENIDCSVVRSESIQLNWIDARSSHYTYHVGPYSGRLTSCSGTQATFALAQAVVNQLQNATIDSPLTKVTLAPPFRRFSEVPAAILILLFDGYDYDRDSSGNNMFIEGNLDRNHYFPTQGNLEEHIFLVGTTTWQW